MEIAEIRQRVKEELCSYNDFYFGTHPNPDVSILPHIVRWPDQKDYRSFNIECDLNPERTTKGMRSTELHFRYRMDEPAMAINFFYITPPLRKRGLGRLLLHIAENIGRSLECEGRFYITEVTNPGFWRHMGFRPIERPGQQVFWDQAVVQ